MRTDTWLTPPYIIEALGVFDLDPCAAVGQPWATATKMLTIHDDGLRSEWMGRVWMNPPYKKGVINKWMLKLSEHGNGTALVFTRTDTAWFEEFVWKKADSIFFFHGRVKFYTIDGKRAGNCGGSPSCLIAYGENNSEAIHNSRLKGRHQPVNYIPVIVVGVSPTWKAVITIAVNRSSGEADLQTVYDIVEQIAPDKVSQNRHFKAKIRQTLQYHFTRIAKGRYTTPTE